MQKGLTEHERFYSAIKKLGSHVRTNTAIKGTRLRPDAIDFKNRIIYELKPSTERGMRAGERQLKAYLEAAKAAYGGEWTTRLVQY